ncbi:MAG: Arc family DNA-binding protein, partial [Thermoanaerobaculia bacterium]
MNAQAVTLHLPADLYDLFRRRARETHRSLETEILEVVSTAAPKTEELPAELARALEDLKELDDEA